MDSVNLRGNLGVDFGGVIVRSGIAMPGEDTTHHLDGVMAAHLGAFEGFASLFQAFSGRVWIVSKAGPRMQSLTRAWLDHVSFYSRTGFPAANLRFCMKREDKLGICEELAIRHFIDDRLDVLEVLRSTVEHLYLFGDAADAARCPPWATFLPSWERATLLLTQLARTESGSVAAHGDTPVAKGKRPN